LQEFFPSRPLNDAALPRKLGNGRKRPPLQLKSPGRLAEMLEQYPTHNLPSIDH
jgi:hypothetical protein